MSNLRQLPKSEDSATVLEHFEELRSRSLKYLAIFVVASGVGYLIRDSLLEIVFLPLDQPLYYTSPTGAFDLIIKVSLLFGFLVATPVLLYQTFQFVKPVLTPKLQSNALLIVIISALLTAAGVCFSYFVTLPAALYFLNQFQTESVQALITTDAYISFVIRYIACFALLFQLPLMGVLFNSVHRLSVRQLLRRLDMVILGCFILAAVFTPTPDLINQLFMAVPMIGLFLITILVIALMNRRSMSY